MGQEFVGWEFVGVFKAVLLLMGLEKSVCVGLPTPTGMPSSITLQFISSPIGLEFLGAASLREHTEPS